MHTHHKTAISGLAALALVCGLITGCQQHGPSDPMYAAPLPQNQILGDDPFIKGGRLLLTSYKETDASFFDSQRLARGERFHLTESPAVALDQLGSITAVRQLFSQGSPANAVLQQDSATLNAQVKASLNQDPLLDSFHLDQNLNPFTQTGLELQALQAGGYSATASEQARLGTPADLKAQLLNYRNLNADSSNRVQVVSSADGDVKLRLQSTAHAFERTGERSVQTLADGRQQIDTHLTMVKDDGSRLDLTERRLLQNAQGRGAGSFSLISDGKTFQGRFASVAHADGSLMLLLEPSESRLGQLLYIDAGQGQTALLQYDSLGQQVAASRQPLAEALDQLARD